MDDLQDVLTQHVLVFEIDNWDAVVTRAFEDCQPDCLEYSEVRGGIASVNCMASAIGRWGEPEAWGGWSRLPLSFQAHPNQSIAATPAATAAATTTTGTANTAAVTQERKRNIHEQLSQIVSQREVRDRSMSDKSKSPKGPPTGKE